MFSEFIALFFPHNCINCKTGLRTSEKHLCTSCKLNAPYTHDIDFLNNDLLKIFMYEPKIQSAVSFFYFHQKGMAQKLLHQLKYHNKRYVGELLGKWFAEKLKNKLTADMIVPVPLHPTKKKNRGFNQSELIARGMATVLNIPVKTDLVQRIKHTKTQTKANQIQRWINMENVYSEVSETLENKSVIVVDDVITTGATIGMLIDKLVQKKPKSIHIACIARGKL